MRHWFKQIKELFLIDLLFAYAGLIQTTFINSQNFIVLIKSYNFQECLQYIQGRSQELEMGGAKLLGEGSGAA